MSDNIVVDTIASIAGWGWGLFTEPNPLWTKSESIIPGSLPSIVPDGKTVADTSNTFKVAAVKVLDDTSSAVKSTAASIKEVATEAVKNIPTVDEVVNNEWVTKAVVLAFGGSCVLAGASYIYRGISRNCTIRNINRKPVSLLPKPDVGVENEAKAGPPSWYERGKSLVHRAAFPALIGLAPVLAGVYICSHADYFAKLK